MANDASSLSALLCLAAAWRNRTSIFVYKYCQTGFMRKSNNIYLVALYDDDEGLVFLVRIKCLFHFREGYCFEKRRLHKLISQHSV